MKVIAFDVDDTLTISRGPIPVKALRSLRSNPENIIGIAGNWKAFTRWVPDWAQIVSFVGPAGGTKAQFLSHIKSAIKAKTFQLIGNVPDDQQAAKAAGWDFIEVNQWRKPAAARRVPVRPPVPRPSPTGRPAPRLARPATRPPRPPGRR